MTERTLNDSWQIDCRGAQCDDTVKVNEVRNNAAGPNHRVVSLPVLSFEDAEAIIVKVYDDGSSSPLCRYFGRKEGDFGRCKAGTYGRQNRCIYYTLGKEI